MGEKVKIKPILFGGGQQKDLRSGTENVPGIAGLGLATKMIYNDLDMKVALMRELKDYFIEQAGKIENTTVHGLKDEGSAPHIISLGIAGIRSEVLLHTLEDKGIYVSSGSACASNHPAVSGVLRSTRSGRRKSSVTTTRCAALCGRPGTGSHGLSATMPGSGNGMSIPENSMKRTKNMRTCLLYTSPSPRDCS